MKIAILTPTFSQFSGIDRLVEIESKDYRKKGNDITIFTFKAHIKTKNAKVIEIGMPKNPLLERLYRLFFFLDIKKIKKYSDILTNYDMVISHLYPMNILACKAKKKNPRITYIYHNAGVGITETYSLPEKVYLKLFNHLTNKTIMNTDRIISISDFLRRQLLKETGLDSKVEYITIDKKRFHKGIKSSRIRKRYSIKKEPVFFYVGRISPHKGIHLLIRAFKLVQKKYPKAKLIIAGKHTFPKYSKELKKLANKDVIFAGFVPDNELAEYYAACNVYTTASLWEGFDMPAKEAQAVGRPVVAFDAGAHKEVVKNGILVKTGDVKGFAGAVLKLLDS
ncbi:glycosyltransferase family 4 protein [Candidatus Woesearchaeota archaeon]|nr:glycosyltransferase family 4 protein [Candidatus Woesearchaeota archaeon]